MLLQGFAEDPGQSVLLRLLNKMETPLRSKPGKCTEATFFQSACKEAWKTASDAFRYLLGFKEQVEKIVEEMSSWLGSARATNYERW